MTNTTVRNMLSPRSGQPVSNQFIIENDKEVIFQSYETTIAKLIRGGSTVLDRNALDYSVTTSKYLYSFLGLNRKEIQSRIEDGSIILEDLN